MFRIVTKTILIGHDAKSHLHRSFFGETFEKNILDTLGCDFAVKRVFVNPDISVEHQTWDINTRKEFKKLRMRFYNGSTTIIFVFDATQIDSLYDLEQWFEEICTVSKCNDLSIILLSHCSDLVNKIISENQINEFITKISNYCSIKTESIDYYHTSIENGENIETALVNVSRSLYLEATVV